MSKLKCFFGKHEYWKHTTPTASEVDGSLHLFWECWHCDYKKCVSGHNCHRATVEEIRTGLV